jgi:hypothetical protein
VNKATKIQDTRVNFSNDMQSLTNNYNNKISNINNKLAIINENNKLGTTTKNTKKALLIGINYVGTPYTLRGCINDVTKVKSQINSYGFSNQNIKILTDNTPQKPTRENILLEFKNLLANANSGDTLFFLYSGHGTQILDKNNDETSCNNIDVLYELLGKMKKMKESGISETTVSNENIIEQLNIIKKKCNNKLIQTCIQ